MKINENTPVHIVTSYYEDPGYISSEIDPAHNDTFPLKDVLRVLWENPPTRDRGRVHTGFIDGCQFFNYFPGLLTIYHDFETETGESTEELLLKNGSYHTRIQHFGITEWLETVNGNKDGLA